MGFEVWTSKLEELLKILNNTLKILVLTRTKITKSNDLRVKLIEIVTK